MDLAFCYLDEAGCPGWLPTSNSQIQPVFVLTGLFLPESKIRELTKEYVALKVKYYPAEFEHLAHDLEAMRIELKGAELKKDLRKYHKDPARKTAERFLDDLIALVKKCEGKIVSRIWVKGVGEPFNGKSVYALTTQKFSRMFQAYLAEQNSRGVIVADFREPRANSVISHAIFSQKFKRGKKGDVYPAIVESPLFGVSDNHAGLQIVDILTSAIICPIATLVYCTGYVNSSHVNPNNKNIIQRYRKRLRELEYKHFSDRKKVYGMSVHDAHKGRSIQDLWDWAGK
ncbi:DUF3800 domain-containing protein [Xanthomonas nasturtii]|uniref:DUF3800 domain-containing protein n=1 Tax=Xanthomonas nasturtii TaxID=1843581 RepID=UPI002011FDA3|nr:DUF3800 domain-containing protein [Xanthomonas nasturtii]MCL1499354.1 DUF3800 domain-containing protein [Xanthomonas nasturtii]MCL1502966.1 DUF3800 domain-containing protein [Xanthomonas nasturtii]MCL1522894.1 DUF3800 domain-containing protein [Xanthomonas nasturtii]MCL1527456.1 DUF3800 domain-containing protein [Xanthomonas nasturtii]MCL1534926.1 DUF3800 domain-containing protein [Xanthomonas nasturtii]